MVVQRPARTIKVDVTPDDIASEDNPVARAIERALNTIPDYRGIKVLLTGSTAIFGNGWRMLRLPEGAQTAVARYNMKRSISQFSFVLDITTPGF